MTSDLEHKTGEELMDHFACEFVCAMLDIELTSWPAIFMYMYGTQDEKDRIQIRVEDPERKALNP